MQVVAHLEVVETIQQLHLDTKPLHQLDSHVNIRLADQLILPNVNNLFIRNLYKQLFSSSDSHTLMIISRPSLPVDRGAAISSAVRN